LYRRGVEDLAHVGMTHAEGRLESRLLELREPERLGACGSFIHVIAESDVLAGMMGASRKQGLVQPQAHGFRDSPWREPFPANAVEALRRLLQHERGEPLTGESRRQRAAPPPAADYDTLWGIRHGSPAARKTARADGGPEMKLEGSHSAAPAGSMSGS